MSEKRFQIVQGYNDRYCQDLNNNKLLNQNQTVRILNEFYEENQYLKLFIAQLTNNKGEIVLRNGICYNVEKMLEANRMTDKRFRMYKDRYEMIYVKDNDGECIELADEDDILEEDVLKIIDLLNELHEENQQLQKQKQLLIDHMDNWCPKRFYDSILKRMEEIG